MKQKKTIEVKKNIEDDKQKWKMIYFIPELAVFILALVEVYAIGCYIQTESFQLLRVFVMLAMGIGIVGLLIRQNHLDDSLDYDNNMHVFRFWGIFLICLVVAGTCIFIPITGWPFMVIFVTLSLFANMTTGVVAASVLLMLTVFLNGADVGVFMLYFISGTLAASLFRKLDTNFKIGIPIFISVMVLMVCETANIVLFANEQLNIELFVIPITNVVVSSILLIGVLKLFSSIVIYKYRVKYMEITDPEYEILAELKEKERQAYYQSMHTAYFCDRIAKKLGLDASALKAAGYYHKIGMILEEPGNFDQVNQFLKEQQFPPMVIQILREYLAKDTLITSKETAVLVFADAVTASIMYVFTKEKNDTLDYDKIIDKVFFKRIDGGALNYCMITMQEITLMKKIFKEEKLYYDFLR